MSAKQLVIATRGSALALWQAKHVQSLLANLGHQSTLNVIKTEGDRVQDRFLHEIGGKGLFIREIETALAKGEADLAVHSLKDMPAVLPDGFALGALLKRHAPTDIMIFHPRVTGNINPAVATGLTAADVARLGSLQIATASLRRTSLLKRYAPAVTAIGIRGNVDTRIQKLLSGTFDALILAEASLERLGIKDVRASRLAAQWFVPSPGQGALAIEVRSGSAVAEIVARLDDAQTRRAVTIERLILAALGGDCTMPVGVHAAPTVQGGWLVRSCVLDYSGNAVEGVLEFGSATQDSEITAEVMRHLHSVGLDAILKALETKP